MIVFDDLAAPFPSKEIVRPYPSDSFGFDACHFNSSFSLLFDKFSDWDHSRISASFLDITS
jgi:hypothetical protein